MFKKTAQLVRDGFPNDVGGGHWIEVDKVANEVTDMEIDK